MEGTANLTIEHSRRRDLAAVTDCWVRLASEQRDYDSFVLPEDNRDAMADSLAGHHLTDGLLVARIDDEIVGFASFALERGTLELDASRGLLSNLWVDPAYRNRGIGSALLEAVEQNVSRRGGEVLILEVMADNDSARRFYEREGYDQYRVSMARSLDDFHEQTDEPPDVDGSRKSDRDSRVDG